VEGIIHYVQSFCFRQVQDTIVRRELGALPILTLECDRPGSIDMRTETRIEAFLEVLRQRRAEGRPAKDD
jgi:benzoyl-CoA reductase/2-hydroxyglutaryl-CoA dehydratase subunit BcrC/BadD/HgdB